VRLIKLGNRAGVCRDFEALEKEGSAAAALKRKLLRINNDGANQAA
jgi:hypothetical protein